jgi:hypothetical protein
LLIDKDMRPIAYRIFTGDTFEGQTFGATLVEEYTIDQVVVLTGECSAKQFGTSVMLSMN